MDTKDFNKKKKKVMESGSKRKHLQDVGRKAAKERGLAYRTKRNVNGYWELITVADAGRKRDDTQGRSSNTSTQRRRKDKPMTSQTRHTQTAANRRKQMIAAKKAADSESLTRSDSKMLNKLEGLQRSKARVTVEEKEGILEDLEALVHEVDEDSRAYGRALMLYEYFDKKVEVIGYDMDSGYDFTDDEWGEELDRIAEEASERRF